jgi:mannose-6-phosphate isomerase-like protein (cupin superfamily)
MAITLKNPLIKDEVTILESAAETGGVYGLLEVKLHAGGGNALHYHTTFSEHFEVISGILSVQVKDQMHQLRPGEAFTVPPRIAHRFFNETSASVIFRCTIRPARNFEKALRIGYGLAADGKTTKKGLPKNFWHAILLFHFSETYLHGIPLWLQTSLIGLLVRVAKWIGADKAVMKYYSDEYLDRSVTHNRETVL